MTVIYSHGDFAFGSSVTAAIVVYDTEVGQLLVVVVARVTRHHPAVKAAGLTHEVAFVVKTGVTVCAHAKLELIAFLVALILGEVHKGDVRLGSRSIGDSSREKRRTLVILVVQCVVVVVVIACVSVVVPRVVLELLLILFVGGGVFIIVVIPAAVVWLFGLATPFPSSGGGRSGLGSSSSRRHRRHRSLFLVTTIRINVEKVFQFFQMSQ